MVTFFLLSYSIVTITSYLYWIFVVIEKDAPYKALKIYPTFAMIILFCFFINQLTIYERTFFQTGISNLDCWLIIAFSIYGVVAVFQAICLKGE